MPFYIGKTHMKTLKEYLKIESVLKMTLNAAQVKQIQTYQKSITDKDIKPLAVKDLHVTLLDGNEWKSIRNQYRDKELKEIDFNITLESPRRIEGENGRVSYYSKITQQKQMNEYVKGLVGVVNRGRVYHVSIGNRTGRAGDSVREVR
tara:strand:- start:521 stop:964 length:444 start_codon:yes stop_codon:yes gene_type:complete